MNHSICSGAFMSKLSNPVFFAWNNVFMASSSRKIIHFLIGSEHTQVRFMVAIFTSICNLWAMYRNLFERAFLPLQGIYVSCFISMDNLSNVSAWEWIPVNSQKPFEGVGGMQTRKNNLNRALKGHSNDIGNMGLAISWGRMTWTLRWGNFCWKA